MTFPSPKTTNQQAPELSPSQGGGDVGVTATGLQIARLRLLYGPGLTAEERAVFNTLKAKEMAKAEARRKPSLQMEIPGA